MEEGRRRYELLRLDTGQWMHRRGGKEREGVYVTIELRIGDERHRLREKARAGAGQITLAVGAINRLVSVDPLFQEVCADVRLDVWHAASQVRELGQPVDVSVIAKSGEQIMASGFIKNHDVVRASVCAYVQALNELLRQAQQSRRALEAVA